MEKIHRKRKWLSIEGMRMNAGGKPQCCQPAREGERWLKLAEFSRKWLREWLKAKRQRPE